MDWLPRWLMALVSLLECLRKLAGRGGNDARIGGNECGVMMLMEFSSRETTTVKSTRAILQHHTDNSNGIYLRRFFLLACGFTSSPSSSHCLPRWNHHQRCCDRHPCPRSHLRLHHCLHHRLHLHLCLHLHLRLRLCLHPHCHHQHCGHLHNCPSANTFFVLGFSGWFMPVGVTACDH